MKILMLVTDSDTTWMLYNALIESFPDIQVLQEDPISKRVFFKRRIKKFGLIKVIGQILFMLYSKILHKKSRRLIEDILRRNKLSNLKPRGVQMLYVDSVNSWKSEEILMDRSYDVVVVNGTRILSKKIISKISVPIINIHCGITPLYRGVHGAYWALQNRDAGNAGVTIHLVDSGVDTGGIIYQGIIEVDPTDNLVTYPYKQYAVGIPLMEKALLDVKAGRLTTFVRSDLQSEQWVHPTLWAYWINKIRRGIS